MNLSQIKDRIFRSTNHLYQDVFHMLDLINDGMSTVIDAGKLKNKATISVVEGTAAYPLPDDFKAPGILQDETVLNVITTYNLLDINESRYGYAIESGFIYLKPIPQTDTTLTHYYYCYATPLVDDTDIPTAIDEQYHNLLALYAIAMIMPLIPEFNQSSQERAWSMWKEGLQGFAAANERKNKKNKVNEKIVW